MENILPIDMRQNKMLENFKEYSNESPWYKIPLGIKPTETPGEFTPHYWEMHNKDMLSSPHAWIGGYSGSGKTTLIRTMISHLVNKNNVNIVLADTSSMFVSPYRKLEKVNVVSTPKDVLETLRNLKLKTMLIDNFCQKQDIDSIPLDGKLPLGECLVINGYPIMNEIIESELDLGFNSNGEEIDFSEINIEDYIEKKIKIRDIEAKYDKTLKITKDNYQIGGEYEFYPTFVFIDGYSLYSLDHFKQFYEEEDLAEKLYKEYQYLLGELIRIGRKFHIHFVLSSIVCDSETFTRNLKNGLNFRCVCGRVDEEVSKCIINNEEAANISLEFGDTMSYDNGVMARFKSFNTKIDDILKL